MERDDSDISNAGRAAIQRQEEAIQKDKPEEEKSSEPTHINLKVCDQSGNEVFFKIKKTTPLRKLMTAYCGRNAISSEAVRFLYDGCRIQGDQTPESLGIDDNEIIDVVLQQTGG